jgi:hypothetical protein
MDIDAMDVVEVEGREEEALGAAEALCYLFSGAVTTLDEPGEGVDTPTSYVSSQSLANKINLGVQQRDGNNRGGITALRLGKAILGFANIVKRQGAGDLKLRLVNNVHFDIYEDGGKKRYYVVPASKHRQTGNQWHLPALLSGIVYRSLFDYANCLLVFSSHVDRDELLQYISELVTEAPTIQGDANERK